MLSPESPCFSKFAFVFYQATACTMEKIQCFADLSREEVAGLIEGKGSKNMQLVTKTALNTFRALCEEKHPDKMQDFEKRT